MNRPRVGPRRHGRSLLLVLAALPTVQAVSAPSAGGAWAPAQNTVSGWTPAVTVVAPHCRPDVATADAVAGPDGLVHGFAGYVRGTCGDSTVWYFQGRGRRWTQARSPYHGDVLATADDSTGTWLLYLDGRSYDRVLLGRRLRDGRWLAPQTVSRLRGSAIGSGVQGASLLAANGRWWAVWAQALPDPQSSAPATVLFQAKTLGGVQSAHRITTVAAGHQETNPDLVLISDRNGRPTGAQLVWARDVGTVVGGVRVQNDQLRFARAGLNGRWSSRVSVPALSRPHAMKAVLARAAGVTWMTWHRQSMSMGSPAGSRVLATRYPADPRSPHLFTNRGGAPVIAANGSRVDVIWQTPDPARIAMATRRADRWSEQTVPLTPASRRPLLVTTAAGKATVVIQSREATGRLFAITQR